MPTHTLTYSVQGNGEPLTNAVARTASAAIDVQETVSINQTDSVIMVTVDVSALSYIVIHSTAACTIKTYLAAALGDTFAVGADSALAWHSTSPVAVASIFPAGDFDRIKVTTTTPAAVITIKGLQDATP